MNSNSNIMCVPSNISAKVPRKFDEDVMCDKYKNKSRINVFIS